MTREKTNDHEIIKAITNFIGEASPETLVRIFNENFEGNLTYISEEELFEIDTEAAENLELIKY